MCTHRVGCCAPFHAARLMLMMMLSTHASAALAVCSSIDPSEFVCVHQVRMACSPDADVYMLVREPELCRYVVTLYHPLQCSDQETNLHSVGAPSPVPGRNRLDHDEL